MKRAVFHEILVDFEEIIEREVVHRKRKRTHPGAWFQLDFIWIEKKQKSAALLCLIKLGNIKLMIKVLIVGEQIENSLYLHDVFYR